MTAQDYDVMIDCCVTVYTFVHLFETVLALLNSQHCC